jgi:N-ethylmaleimide reductase
MLTLSALFQPLHIGALTLKNRIVFAPCTRNRSRLDGVPTQLNATYYAQRASAGLIVTEGTQPSAMGQGYLFTPGLYNHEHIIGWRRVTNAVHERGGLIFCQLMHAGRLSDPLSLPGAALPIAPSAVQPDPTARHYSLSCPRVMRPYPMPRALSTREIKDVVEEFRHAATCAERAGFDGVEIHAASGYLPMQFLSTNTNRRTDEYGGPIENRARFLLECVEAMAAVQGPKFIAVKVSPGFTFNDVFDVDARATYSYVTRRLSALGIAYLQIANCGIDWDVYGMLRPLFDGPLMAAVGLTRATGAQLIGDGRVDLIAYGQHFIANPDLVERFRGTLPLNRPDSGTYYTQGAEGYTDYPTYIENPGRAELPPDASPAPLLAAK